MNTVQVLKQLASEIASLNKSRTTGGYALLANVGSLQIDSPFEISPGLYVRRASPDEMASLRLATALQTPASVPIPFRNPYETRVDRLPIEHGTDIKTTPLQEAEFRYHIIDYPGTNTEVNALVRTTALTPWELSLGATIQQIGGGTSFGWNPSWARFLDAANDDDEPLLTLGAAELEEIRDVAAKMRNYTDGRTGLERVLTQYHELDTVPRHSPLRFLGYVSILESLVTHAPDPKDPYDSLTRQVRQKMMLLSRRFKHPLPYSKWFPGAPPETIWTKLYMYRSAIAHGSEPDFRGKLQVLRGSAQALSFIRAAVSSVMRSALEEPDLLADLREC